MEKNPIQYFCIVQGISVTYIAAIFFNQVRNKIYFFLFINVKQVKLTLITKVVSITKQNTMYLPNPKNNMLQYRHGGSLWGKSTKKGLAFERESIRAALWL